MEMTRRPSIDLDPAAFVSGADLLGFADPQDIVADPQLTRQRKRQLLAFWGCDIHAVPNTASLLKVAYGPVVEIGEIKEALTQLDEMADLPVQRASPIGSAVAV